MGEVVSIKGEKTDLQGTEATAAIVAWLRDQANILESGEARPAHKAILVVLEDCSGEIRIGPAFCNTSAAERVGILYMALHDIASAD
jgi:hypothetical protein